MASLLYLLDCRLAQPDKLTAHEIFNRLISLFFRGPGYGGGGGGAEGAGIWGGGGKSVQVRDLDLCQFWNYMTSQLTRDA